MPQTKQRKREYMRDYMRRRRAAPGELTPEVLWHGHREALRRIVWWEEVMREYGYWNGA